MRQLCKYLVALSLLLSASLNYTMDNIKLDTSNVTKAGCCGPCGGGGCCGPCGGGGCNPCGSGGCCGPCGSSCGPCFTLSSGSCNSCCGPCGGCCNYSCSDCCNTCCQASACGYPFFAYRSTGINAARDVVGIQPWINQDDMDATSGVLSVALEYTRSLRSCKIAQFLFGCDLMGCNTLAIQGSGISGRYSCAWLADYFGLSPAYDGRVTFCPRIENVIVNFDFYLGLDGIREGLYFRVHSPLTWTRWNLNMCECIENTGIIDGEEIGFNPTYMAGEPAKIETYSGPVNVTYHGIVDRSELPKSFTEAMSGWATWGDMQSPMCYGRIAACGLKRTMLADIHTELGWNFVREEDKHLGINLRLVLPTGTKPNAQYLFEPQIGDSKHWQLGAGLTSSWITWRNKDNDDNYCGFYFDANLLHMFKACQCRSFDFCCKPNSRYMLLAEMGDNEDGLLAGDALATAVETPYQYKKSLLPAINYTTLNLDVKIAVQADLMVKFSYVKDNWSWDIGYNLWARSGEKFRFNDCCSAKGCCCGSSCGCTSCNDCGYFNNCCNTCCVPVCSPCGGSCSNNCCVPCSSCGPCGTRCGSGGGCCSNNCNDCCSFKLCGPCCATNCGCGDNKYVIKGDAILYGSPGTVANPNTYFNDPMPLSFSQCKADIHAGENSKLTEGPVNKGIDDARLAYPPSLTGRTNALYSELDLYVNKGNLPASLADMQIYTSLAPNFISYNDLNFCKSPGALSHKIFMHFNYAWKQREDSYTPFIGLGGEAEFDPGCNSCRFAVSQWGIWVKAGFAFE